MTATARGAAAWVVAVSVAGLCAVQAVQAWAMARNGDAAVLQGIAPGRLCSVLLTNGQVYYGRLVQAGVQQVQVAEVYYVQSAVDPQTHEPGNRLVNRRRNDWHAPESMVIPRDKVVLVEAVGAQSRLAKLIEQDQAAPPVQ